MRKFIFSIFFLPGWVCCFSQPSRAPHTKSHGLPLIRTDFHDSLLRIAYIHLHPNETTAFDAVQQFLRTYKGNLLYVECEQERNITIALHDCAFEFHPNRLFTAAGRRTTITPYSATA